MLNTKYKGLKEGLEVKNFSEAFKRIFLSNKDIDILMSNRKGKLFHILKWLIVILFGFVVIHLFYTQNRLAGMSIEEQVDYTVFGLNGELFYSIIHSVGIGLLLLAYIILEIICRSIVIEVRYERLLHKLKRCLREDKKC